MSCEHKNKQRFTKLIVLTKRLVKIRNCTRFSIFTAMIFILNFRQCHLFSPDTTDKFHWWKCRSCCNFTCFYSCTYSLQEVSITYCDIILTFGDSASSSNLHLQRVGLFSQYLFIFYGSKSMEYRLHLIKKDNSRKMTPTIFLHDFTVYSLL